MVNDQSLSIVQPLTLIFADSRQGSSYIIFCNDRFSVVTIQAVAERYNKEAYRYLSLSHWHRPFLRDRLPVLSATSPQTAPACSA